MRFSVSMGLAVAALALPFGQSKASAWFKFHNATGKTVNVAFVRYKPGCEGGVPWEKRGWWVLAPGETKTVQGDAITNRYSYYYAESTDQTLFWTSSSPTTCMPRTAFTWCWTTCNTAPSTRYYGLRRVDTGNYSNFTLNLTQGSGAPRPVDGANEDATESVAGPGGSGPSGNGAGGRSEMEITATGGTAAPGDGSSSEAATESSGAPGRTTESISAAGPRGAAPVPPRNDPPAVMPASPHVVVVAQPDGTKLALHLVGDEKSNRYTDLNDNPVVKEADGRYVYAVVDQQGKPKATDRVVGKAATPARTAAPDPMDDTEQHPRTDPMGTSGKVPPTQAQLPPPSPGRSN